MILQITSDGSSTLLNAKINETYHSSEGAIMESKHVYVTPAFNEFPNKKQLNILEIGFGTGLNAIITLLNAESLKIDTYYETIEPYPIPEPIYTTLNYAELLNCEKELFYSLHKCDSNTILSLPYFNFVKKYIKIEDYLFDKKFDVIYFDAFSPNSQPEMWSENIFDKIHSCLSPNGILLTYSSKGIVKKALRNVGFNVIRLHGAGNKRHMLKAVKI